jgi:ABC-type multidrug transport system ATPase subunit
MHQGRVVACGTPLELKALAGQRSVLEIRAVALPAAAIEAVRRMSGVRTAVAAPVGGDSLEESLRVHCEDADAFAGRGVDLLRRHGVEITSVEVQEPTLEDAFIALTERRLE